MISNEKVLELATEWHKEHKRRNGDPYITHPIRVANKTKEIAKERGYYLEQTNIIYQAALLHDVLEDCNDVTILVMERKGLDLDVISICNLLNKNNYSNYFEYIKRISEDTFASIVKYCDLCDNLVGLDPTEKNKRDKYLLSKYILEQSLGIY